MGERKEMVRFHKVCSCGDSFIPTGKAGKLCEKCLKKRRIIGVKKLKKIWAWKVKRKKQRESEMLVCLIKQEYATLEGVDVHVDLSNMLVVWKILTEEDMWG